MVTVPIATAYTLPAASTDAMAGLEDAHVPPGGEQLKRPVPPVQRVVEPAITPVTATTVMVCVSIRPQESVKVMSVLPAASVVTTPVADIVATLVLLLAHDTPGSLAVRV